MISNKEILFYKSMAVLFFAFQVLAYLSLIFIAVKNK